MRSSVRVIFLLICFFIGSSGSAQSDLRFKTVSLLQGLSQSTVNSIVQDDKGFIWIGTQDGLNRYDGYSFKVYKHNPQDPNSLSDNYIQTLFVDSKGVLWIGTYGGGISIFDRQTEKFTNFRNDEKNASSLSNNLVMAITEDDKGNIWIGTSGGLNRFNQKSKVFERFLHSSEVTTSISSNKIRCLFYDTLNRLWIGTADNGFNLLLKGSTNFKRFVSNGRNGSLSNNFVQCISQTSDGELLIGTSGGGVNYFDPQENTFKYLIVPSTEKTGHYNDVWSVFEDKNKNIWIGTYGAGLLKYSSANKKWNEYKNDPTDLSSLGNNIILSSYSDRQGFIWMGTLGGGLSYFDPKGTTFRTIRHNPSDPNSLNENVVMSIFEDPGKALYVGTYGGGLNIFDYSNNKVSVFKSSFEKGSLPSDIVRTVFKDSKGRIWIGSYNGGLSEYINGRFISYRHDSSDLKSISADDVWCIKEDSTGMLWIGTWGGGLNKFDPDTKEFLSFRNNADDKSSLSNDKVISLLIDSGERIWVGTNGGGLARFDPASQKFFHYRNNSADSTTIPSERIRCIFEDSRHDIWVGTDGGGIARLQANGRFSRFNSRHGLPNDVVYGMVQDGNDYLWLSTNNGLCRFSIKDFSVRNFDITDGLQGNEFNQGAVFKNLSGEIYFGGIGGISFFNPSNVSLNTFIPPLVLTSVKLFGKEFGTNNLTSDSVKTLELSYDQNFFSFEFAALDFTAPEKNQYACMMEGFDRDWINLGNKRFVSYTNLDPGEYFFRVIGSNNENVWNREGLRIRVVITPPFYKTTWFYITLLVLVLFCIYCFIHFRTKKLARDKKRLEEEVNIRTNEVVKQKEIIEGKNKDITDSINYARRIQRAIFPSYESFNKAFPEAFILYKPKDIVSGDFYWMERFGDDIFIAVVDCTGHGVPGAFLSIVGNNLLNQAVNEHGISKPSLILNEMNKNLAKLIRNQDDYDFKDGMDMALIAINKKTGRLQFAGANNPLWIIRNEGKVFEEVRGDKRPIGSFDQSGTPSFTNHELTVVAGDTVYLSTDGYSDQFGGKEGKKFKKSRFRSLLAEISEKPMAAQRSYLDGTFETWKREFEQVDDILVIGIRFE